MIKDYKDRESVVRELARIYGGGSFYSKHFIDKPSGEIFFHKKTGFSIGAFFDKGTGYVSDPTGLQAKYVITSTEVSSGCDGRD